MKEKRKGRELDASWEHTLIKNMAPELLQGSSIYRAEFFMQAQRFLCFSGSSLELASTGACAEQSYLGSI